MSSEFVCEELAVRFLVNAGEWECLDGDCGIYTFLKKEAYYIHIERR